MKVSDFHYDLPEEAIAQSAIEPRHNSRLLDARDMSDHRFFDLPGLLRPGDLLVVNETRVRAARLFGTRRETGGRVELLLLERSEDGVWEALAKPARRLRPGIVIDFEGISATVVSDPREGVIELTLDAEDEEEIIAGVGVMPLPPYFRGRLSDASRYQTMFANRPGSAAAPTAALHFTSDVMDALDNRGVTTARVDLHVSLDTFRPMSAGMVEDHRMHTEWCTISDTTAEEIDRAERVIAVGTTVVRTLESFASGRGHVASGSRQTDLFLRPGSEFQVVDGLITNFHMPESTLLVLLAAFMGDRWREAYETALARGYRFLSFGDAMYAERD